MKKSTGLLKTALFAVLFLSALSGLVCAAAAEAQGVGAAEYVSTDEISPRLLANGESGGSVVTGDLSTGSVSAGLKRDSLKSSYQTIYDVVYQNFDVLKGDYEAGALLFDFSGYNITYKYSSGDTIYIPLGTILNDHPELEWMNPAALEEVVDSENNLLIGIRLRDGYTNARTSSYQDKSVFDAEMAEVEEVVSGILAQAEACSSDYEKLLLFHDWLVTNNEYNSYVASNQSDLADVRTWSAVSAFLSANDPYTGPVCEGYAEAFKILCDRAGIPCALLVGMDHEWNVVQLDGKWYAVDCTWDDPLMGSHRYDYVRYTYFLVGTNTPTAGSTYGEDHISYSSGVPQVSEKGYAVISGLSVSDAEFDGSEKTAFGEATVLRAGEELQSAVTFNYYESDGNGGWLELSSAPVNAGEYLVCAELDDSAYEVYWQETYSVLPCDISGRKIGVSFNGGESIADGISVTLSGKELTAGTDYSLECDESAGSGIVAVTVTGTGNYSGSVSFSITVPVPAAAPTPAVTPKPAVTAGPQSDDANTESDDASAAAAPTAAPEESGETSRPESGSPEESGDAESGETGEKAESSESSAGEEAGASDEEDFVLEDAGSVASFLPWVAAGIIILVLICAAVAIALRLKDRRRR